MNKKGFTLTEILVVIVIIVTVTGTTTYGIDKLMKNTKERKLNEIINEIEQSTEVYFSNNEIYRKSLLNNEVEEICTRVYTLQNASLIDDPLKNPVTDELIPANLCVYSKLNEKGIIEHNFNLK